MNPTSKRLAIHLYSIIKISILIGCLEYALLTFWVIMLWGGPRFFGDSLVPLVKTFYFAPWLLNSPGDIGFRSWLIASLTWGLIFHFLFAERKYLRNAQRRTKLTTR